MTKPQVLGSEILEVFLPCFTNVIVKMYMLTELRFEISLSINLINILKFKVNVHSNFFVDDDEKVNKRSRKVLYVYSNICVLWDRVSLKSGLVSSKVLASGNGKTGNQSP